MIRAVIFLLLLCPVLYADWMATCKDGSKILLVFSSESFEEEKEVYCASFGEAYSTNPQIMSDFQKRKLSLDSFLTFSFAREERAFRKKSNTMAFLSARTVDGKTIGYASFDNEGSSIYVRILAVHPKYWNRGVGALLLFSIFNVWKERRHLRLMTRSADIRAVTFYRNQGFSFSSFTQGGFDPNIYCGLVCLMSESKLQEVLRRYSEVGSSN